MKVQNEFVHNGITYRVLIDESGDLITDSDEMGIFMWEIER